jgi:poly-gamma-glutamate synthesis protein (capsule biosynthesis protein)
MKMCKCIILKIKNIKYKIKNYTGVLLLFFLIVAGKSVTAQELLPNSIPSDTSHLRVIFAGDMMGHMPLVNSCMTENGNYDYLPIFENIRTYISSADIAVANLELTLAGPPYTGYPQFSSPDAVAEGLKKVGFNVLVTANNHALDRGKLGVDRTIMMLDSFHFYHTGTFKDSLDKSLHHPLYIYKNNIRLAMLNYTYGTNGFKIQPPAIINYLDTAEIRHDIESCKRNKADYIIVIFHWGIEYERNPNINQRKIAEFIRSLGADAVIGSHPHVVQTLELFGNLHNQESNFPVVFSLGNFVSNQRDRYKDGGILIELDLSKNNDTHLQSVSYLPVWVYKGVINGKISYRLIPPQKFSDLIPIYNISDKDQNAANLFFEDTSTQLNNIKVADIK